MIKIKEAIVVEGRYDKNTLSQIVDSPILETSGFGIFKNKEQLAFLRKVAQQRGLIVFTDSDGAGFVIRNYLKGAIPVHQVKHAYIPDIPGKERRKATPGKEGKLGVEGMSPTVLERSLRQCGATFLEGEQGNLFDNGLTKADLCAAGLSGGAESGKKRLELLKKLALPEHMSANGLLAVLNSCYPLEEARQILGI